MIQSDPIHESHTHTAYECLGIVHMQMSVFLPHWRWNVDALNIASATRNGWRNMALWNYDVMSCLMDDGADLIKDVIAVHLFSFTDREKSSKGQKCNWYVYGSFSFQSTDMKQDMFVRPFILKAKKPERTNLLELPHASRLKRWIWLTCFCACPNVTLDKYTNGSDDTGLLRQYEAKNRPVILLRNTVKATLIESEMKCRYPYSDLHCWLLPCSLTNWPSRRVNAAKNKAFRCNLLG